MLQNSKNSVNEVGRTVCASDNFQIISACLADAQTVRHYIPGAMSSVKLIIRGVAILCLGEGVGEGADATEVGGMHAAADGQHRCHLCHPFHAAEGVAHQFSGHRRP